MTHSAKSATASQAALVCLAVLVLCTAGRTQSPPAPAASITSPTSGTTFNTAYVQVYATITGFSSITSAYLTVTNNAGQQQQPTLPLYGGPQVYYATTNNVPLIQGPATNYNGNVTYQVFVTGYNSASPPVQTTAFSMPLTVTVQIGYIFLPSAPSTTATVTTPLNNAMVHMSADTPGSFQISSKYKFGFSRYDTFGSYSPTVAYKLQTTFPDGGGLHDVMAQTMQAQLYQQTGDVSREFNLDYSQGYKTTDTGTVNRQFSNKAVGYYPVGTEVASDLTTANEVRP